MWVLHDRSSDFMTHKYINVMIETYTKSLKKTKDAKKYQHLNGKISELRRFH